MTVTKQVERRVTPPKQWVTNTPVPYLDGETYQAVLELALKSRAAVHLCNEDKASLREWIKDESDGNGSN